MAAVKNIVAIKESSDDVAPHHRPPQRDSATRFALFCGVDDLVLESIVLGIDGWVSRPRPTSSRTKSMALWNCRPGRPLSTKRARIYRWFTPLLHLDTADQAGPVHQARPAVSAWAPKGSAPRLALEGAERKRVLGLYETALAKRPTLKKAAERTASEFKTRIVVMVSEGVPSTSFSQRTDRDVFPAYS